MTPHKYFQTVCFKILYTFNVDKLRLIATLAQDSEDLPWLLGFLRHCASFFACICLFQQRMIIIKMIEASIQIMNVGPGSNGCFNTTSIPNHSLSIIAMLLCVHLQIYPMELLLIRSTFLLMGLPASYLGGFLCRACINFQFTLCRHDASLIARIIRSFWCENHQYLFCHAGAFVWYMGVSKNWVPPIIMNVLGFSIINHPFWGTPVFGNPHIDLLISNDVIPGHGSGLGSLPYHCPIGWALIGRNATTKATKQQKKGWKVQKLAWFLHFLGSPFDLILPECNCTYMSTTLFRDALRVETKVFWSMQKKL